MITDQASAEPVLLITGASTGIGAATARQAVEAGWRVVLGARSEEALRELASELGGEDRALARRCDVSSFEDQETLVAAALDGFGRLDAVFANAGTGAGRGFLNESVEHWRTMVETNVLGVALTIRAALPHLRDSRAGHFVITGSVARSPAAARLALLGHQVRGRSDAEGLRQEIRNDMPNTDIRVTLVSPGWSTRRSSTTAPRTRSPTPMWPAPSCTRSHNRRTSTSTRSCCGPSANRCSAPRPGLRP